MKFERYKNYYDIVILPSVEVRDFAIAQSRAIHEHVGSDLVLGERSFKPHVSLYHVAVKTKNLPEMIWRLRAIVRVQKAVGSLSVQRYENQPHLAVSKTAWLARLHQTVLTAINPLRDKSFPNTWKNNWTTYGMTVRAIHLKNIQNYGSPVVGVIFDPHITLTVLNDVTVSAKAVDVISNKKLRFTPSAITICKIGRYHSCHKVIAMIPFSV